MQENATYSVISPEGCAAILWRDAAFAPQAAEALRPTASQLLALNVIERVIKEPRGGAQNNPEHAANDLRQALRETLAELVAIDPMLRRAQRRKRFRRLGEFSEGTVAGAMVNLLPSLSPRPLRDV
jgi:acetyl-CoA carboxylase carboxyl transferase subunit alpha